MIGIIKDEDCIYIEFQPRFIKAAPNWLVLKIDYTPKRYGEYGVAFSRDGFDITLWWHWGITTYNYSFSSLKWKIKQMLSK